MRCTLACGDIPSLHPSCNMKQHKPETPTIAPNPPLSLKLSSAATERPPHMIILKNTGGRASPVATARLLDSLNRSGGKSGSVEPNHEGSDEEKDKAEQHSLKEGNAHFNQRANHLDQLLRLAAAGGAVQVCKKVQMATRKRRGP